jgi:hypothetical protein
MNEEMLSEYSVSAPGVDSDSRPSSSQKDSAPSDPAQAALIKLWEGRCVSRLKSLDENQFKVMRENMQLARHGATKNWMADPESYVAPILNRHINTQVAMLYAKDVEPKVSRKQRLLSTVWDGSSQSLAEAQMLAAQGDPNAMAIVEDALMVREQNRKTEKLGKTMEYLWSYFLSEQDSNYKKQFKALVRRSKVCSVGYTVLGFQRVMQPDPSKVGKINDVTEQLAAFDRLQKENDEGGIEAESPDVANLKNLMTQLQSTPDLIVREGPVFDFPKSTTIIIDPACTSLSTLAGANWWAQYWDLDHETIKETYGKDVSGKSTVYSDKSATNKTEKDDSEKQNTMARVWRVQDKKLRQEFVFCEGYSEWLKSPGDPDVRIDRFFTLFPLVFNEVEDDDVYPPSDIQQARHAQMEYNRSRNGLREHRVQNRPAYVAATGKFQETDKAKLQSYASGELLEIASLAPGERIADVLQAKPTVPIDPNLYEVRMVYEDILRVVGSQEATFGQPGDTTATASSIAENSRQSTLADNVDDLDEFLSELAKATGQLLLLEMSVDKVVEIVGPGAVWPESPLTRSEIAKDLVLDIKAGSSGRPNKTLEFANLERALPYVMQLPGINTAPFVEKICELLDIDLQRALEEGLPSVTAVNAMMAKMQGAGQPQIGTGDASTDPNAQGAAGVANAPAGPQVPPSPSSQIAPQM